MSRLRRVVRGLVGGLVLGAALTNNVALPAVHDESVDGDLSVFPSFSDIGMLPLGTSEIRATILFGSVIDGFDNFTFSLPATADRLIITQAAATVFDITPGTVRWDYDTVLSASGTPLASASQNMLQAGPQVLFDLAIGADARAVPIEFLQSAANLQSDPVGLVGASDYTLTFQVLDSQAVPLPPAAMMLGCGLLGTLLASRRRRD